MNCKYCNDKGYIVVFVDGCDKDIEICPKCLDNKKFTKKLRELRGLRDLEKVKKALDDTNKEV